MSYYEYIDVSFVKFGLELYNWGVILVVRREARMWFLNYEIDLLC